MLRFLGGLPLPKAVLHQPTVHGVSDRHFCRELAVYDFTDEFVALHLLRGLAIHGRCQVQIQLVGRDSTEHSAHFHRGEGNRSLLD